MHRLTKAARIGYQSLPQRATQSYLRRLPKAVCIGYWILPAQAIESCMHRLTKAACIGYQRLPQQATQSYLHRLPKRLSAQAAESCLHKLRKAALLTKSGDVKQSDVNMTSGLNFAKVRPYIAALLRNILMTYDSCHTNKYFARSLWLVSRTHLSTFRYLCGLVQRQLHLSPKM